jgi:prepilin signal peptidase PulO-like enzyme (type II secretory pathway)
LVGDLVGGYLVVVALLAVSFINLAADRVPRGESVVSPRSHCRGCGRALNFVDLLPIAGYAIRAGRCATCRTPIGIGSPVVEGTSGLLMLAALAWWGLWPGALAGAALVASWGAAAVLHALLRRVHLARVEGVAAGVTLADDAGSDQLVQRTL